MTDRERKIVREFLDAVTDEVDFDAIGTRTPLGKATNAVYALLAEGGNEPEWTNEPPTKQGEYWHWNGEEDSAPLPMFVLYSGTSGKCFVSMGQLGLTRAIDCDQYGGWWKRMVAPELPEVP